MNATATIQVQVVSPAPETQVLLAAKGRHWIGRAPDCALPLQGPSISRRHVSVAWTEHGLVISDDSANGTVVEGEMLRKATRIVPGGAAILGVGQFLLRVVPPTRSPNGGEKSPDAPPSQTPLERRAVHRRLLEHLDLAGVELRAMAPETLRPRVEAALRRILAPDTSSHDSLPDESLVRELADEALGLGPLEQLLHDESVSEIMVVDPITIFVERSGKIENTGLRFTDEDSVRAVIERIVTPLGRRIDESTPLVDARLPDGSRVNAVIPPLALRGPCITIRRFARTPLNASDLVNLGALTESMAQFLSRSVAARKNILVSGGTGSGKTTLLNVLSAAIPAHERIVTVEDAAELRLTQAHVVSLEARPANLEGKGEYTIRDLVRNALRMRPDRIVVGECRGGEAVDMLQAMNTGHEGSLTTVHANSPHEAIARLETLCLMSGLDLPARAIRQQIARSIHLVVQQCRFSDGSRRITSITEVLGIDEADDVELRELFTFKKAREIAGASVSGEFVPSGYLPTFIGEFLARGMSPEEAFA